MSYSVRKADDAEDNKIEEDWGSLTWLASQQIGNAERLTVGRVIIKPGQCNPRHSHPGCEEVLYLLRGRLKHSMGDQTAILEPGDTLVVTQDVAHNAVNTGDEDADMIVAYSSGTRDFKLES